MPENHRLRASRSALAISLAGASLVWTSESMAQVRSTIQTTARVVDAGAGWAADGAVSAALAAARSPIRLEALQDGRLIVISPGPGLEGVPTPRVSLYGEFEACDDVDHGRGEARSESPRHDGPGESRSDATDQRGSTGRTRSRALGRPCVTPARVVAGQGRSLRLIVQVEHISN